MPNPWVPPAFPALWEILLLALGSWRETRDISAPLRKMLALFSTGCLFLLLGVILFDYAVLGTREDSVVLFLPMVLCFSEHHLLSFSMLASLPSVIAMLGFLSCPESLSSFLYPPGCMAISESAQHSSSPKCWQRRAEMQPFCSGSSDFCLCLASKQGISCKPDLVIVDEVGNAERGKKQFKACRNLGCLAITFAFRSTSCSAQH